MSRQRQVLTKLSNDKQWYYTHITAHWHGIATTVMNVSEKNKGGSNAVASSYFRFDASGHIYKSIDTLDTLPNNANRKTAMTCAWLRKRASSCYRRTVGCLRRKSSNAMKRFTSFRQDRITSSITKRNKEPFGLRHKMHGWWSVAP